MNILGFRQTHAGACITGAHGWREIEGRYIRLGIAVSQNVNGLHMVFCRHRVVDVERHLYGIAVFSDFRQVQHDQRIVTGSAAGDVIDSGRDLFGAGEGNAGQRHACASGADIGQCLASRDRFQDMCLHERAPFALFNQRGSSAT